MADRMVRDQIVIGIRDMKLKERLIREKDLNLEKCIELCKISESTDCSNLFQIEKNPISRERSKCCGEKEDIQVKEEAQSPN